MNPCESVIDFVCVEMFGNQLRNKLYRKNEIEIASKDARLREIGWIRKRIKKRRRIRSENEMENEENERRQQTKDIVSNENDEKQVFWL